MCGRVPNPPGAQKALAKVLPLRVSWLGFPRNEAELFAEPRRFFQLLQASGCVRSAPADLKIKTVGV